MMIALHDMAHIYGFPRRARLIKSVTEILAGSADFWSILQHIERLHLGHSIPSPG